MSILFFSKIYLYFLNVIDDWNIGKIKYLKMYLALLYLKIKVYHLFL